MTFIYQHTMKYSQHLVQCGLYLYVTDEHHVCSGFNVAWGLDESLSCPCILRGFELDSKTGKGRVIIEVDAAGNKIIEDEEGKGLKNENHVISRRGVNLYSVYYDSSDTPTYLEKYGA